jgi:hypothetical protein
MFFFLRENRQYVGQLSSKRFKLKIIVPFPTAACLGECFYRPGHHASLFYWPGTPYPWLPNNNQSII